jgi:hypothetical protein
VHRQIQVDRPRRDTCQGKHRGHRGRAARRVVQMPGDDQRAGSRPSCRPAGGHVT